MKKRIQIIITLIILIIVIILLLVRCSKVNTEKTTVAGSSSTEIDSCISNTSSAENSSTSNSNSTNAYISALNSSTETNNSSHTIPSPKTEESSESSPVAEVVTEESAVATINESSFVPENSGYAPVNNSNHQPTNSTSTNENSQPVNSTPTNENSQPVNSTPANENSQPVNSTPANENSQPSNSVPANENSQPANSSPMNGNSTSSQNCYHDWSSRLVTIHHEAECADEPIYGVMQGIVEDAYDECVGYRPGRIMSDGMLFFIDDYGSMSDYEAAVRRYANANNVSSSTYYQPIYVHHDAVYGDVPDYDNVVGYTKVEIIPAWDEQTFEYYCTKCGEILN